MATTAAIVLVATAATVYFINPFHTASRDPRGRVFGYLLYAFEMHHGVISLDGRVLPEPYLPKIPLMPDLNADVDSVAVPAGNFYVLGDNRGNSVDSRVWGMVPREVVIGVYTPGD